MTYDSICEHCDAPCEYDSEMCLCTECEKQAKGDKTMDTQGEKNAALARSAIGCEPDKTGAKTMRDNTPEEIAEALAVDLDAPNPSTWKLVHTTPIECTMDDSGVYTVINRIVESDAHKGYIGQRISVRCDVMSSDDEPLISFQGSANDVRKYVIRYLDDMRFISTEHASYIGWELHRAEVDPNYVQD